MKEFFEKNKIFIAVIIAAFIIGGFVYLSKSPSIGPVSLKEKTTTEIVEENISAVVLIECLDKEGNPLGSGSGFFITPDGKLVTNYHVIEGCGQMQVKLYNAGFSSVKEVLGADKYRDVAVLKIDGRDLPSVKLGDSDKIKIGEKVIAIGNPLGLESVVSDGIISNPNQRLNGDIFIQTTAPISPGNSGGPLLNQMGETIGITSLSIVRLMKIGEIELPTGETQNLNFAIPINDVKEFLFNKLALEVRRFTENAEYYYIAGILAEDEDEAIKNLKKAIALDEEYLDAYLELGFIYEWREDYDKAIENYKKVIELDLGNEYIDVYFWLGYIYEVKEDYDKAIEVFERVIEIDSESADAAYAYDELGLIYDIKGQYDLGLEMGKKAVELMPDDPDFHFNLAVAYENNGLYDLAITEYKKVIEMVPDDEVTHLYLGILYVIQGEYGKAFQQYKSLLKLNPGQAGILKQLIEKSK